MNIIFIVLIIIVAVVFILMFALLFLTSFFKGIISSVYKFFKRYDDKCSFCGHHTMKLYKTESGYKKVCRRCNFSVEIKDDETSSDSEVGNRENIN